MKKIALAAALFVPMLASAATQTLTTALNIKTPPGISQPGYPALDSRSAVLHFNGGAVLMKNAPASLAGHYWFTAENQTLVSADQCTVIKEGKAYSEERSEIDCNGTRYQVNNWHYELNGQDELVKLFAFNAAELVKKAEAVK